MRICTGNCGRHGHPEFELEVGDLAVARADAQWLVGYLEDRVAEGRRFAPGEHVQLGWMTTEVRQAAGGRLSLFEPDMRRMPIVFVDSVAQTLLQLRVQQAVAESLGLEDDLSFPSILESGLACARLRGGAGEGLVLSRAAPEDGDSGWFVGCGSPAHDHNDPANLRRASLYQLFLAAPALLEFAALPPGITVELGEDGGLAVTFEGRELRPKPGSYLARRGNRS